MTYLKTGEGVRRVRNISELARLAGVSAGTVSRALAGKDLVNRQTRERIQALAREHGFRPNQMASRLRTGQTGVIGLVVPLGHERGQMLSDPFFMTLLGHLADAVAERGYDLMLSRVIPADGDDWLERIVDSGMLEGVLMIGQSDQFETIERVAADFRPLVVWGAYRQGQTHCAVGTDSFTGGKLAAARLLDSGKRRLAFFGNTNDAETALRLAGARAALAERGPGANGAGGTAATIEVVPIALAPEGLEERIAGHLAGLDPATDGIFAASDVIAMAVLRVLHERGRRVPTDIAVVGYDDLPLATQTTPPLTTIHQDIAAGAQAMIDSLFDRIAGKDTGSTALEPRLVVRESA